MWIGIDPYFRPGKSSLRILQNNKGRMVRPWAELRKDQYERLKELREKRGKPVSEMIRESVSRFVKRRDHPVGMVSSYLPKVSRDNYRTVPAYLPGSDLSLLAKISKKTGRPRIHLIREAVDSYLGELT